MERAVADGQAEIGGIGEQRRVVLGFRRQGKAGHAVVGADGVAESLQVEQVPEKTDMAAVAVHSLADGAEEVHARGGEIAEAAEAAA